MNPPLANGTELAALARRTADLRLVDPPTGGWLRSVRQALGLSRREIAQRLGVTQAAVRDYEAAEASDAISLSTLRRTARSLGCELVVALVPGGGRSFAELAPTMTTPRKPRVPRQPRLVGPPPSRARAADAEELADYLK